MLYKNKNRFLLSLFALWATNLCSNDYYLKDNLNLEQSAHKILAYAENEEVSPILSQEAVVDLSLIIGKKKGDTGLITKINRTKTYLGYETLKYLLTHPLKVKDQNILLKRQAIIKNLQKSENLEFIEKNISTIAKNEEALLNLLTKDNIAESDFLSLSTQLVGIDRSATLTELTRLGSLSGIAALGTASSAYSILKLVHLGGYLCRLYDERVNNNYGKIDVNFYGPDAAGLILSLGATYFIKNKLIPAFKNQEEVSKKMLKDLVIAHEFLNTCYRLDSNLLENKIDIKKDLIYGANFNLYTKSFKGLSKELKNLIQTLQTSTFDKVSSFKFMGRVRVAYKKLNESKSQFKNLLRAVGEIDAYLSFVRLMEEYKDKSVHYCFTQYLDNEFPIVRFKNAWHPTVEQSKIITHSLNLGSNKDLDLKDLNNLDNAYYPNIYITAPNGAGKSTLLLEVALNTVLSQTGGFAAADEFATTLFDSIVIHSNLEHNAKEGQSTYGVEQAKMNELNVAIKSGCNNHKKVLAIIDEPFKSTKEKLASVCLTDFIKDVEFYDKSICMIASHFLSPAEKIEERNNNRFVNLHIPVFEEPKNSGKFNRGFKLKTGIDYEWFNQAQEDSSWMLRYNSWLAFTRLIK